MIDRTALLTDLRKQVRTLEDDLRERAAEVPEFDAALRAEWRRAKDAERTAATYGSWLEGQVTQAAVAWVLGTVFLRFCEDNGLIDLPYLAGPGERVELAAERQQEFFTKNPEKTDRDWIIEGFKELSSASPVAAGLFHRDYNPMWRITPSHPAAKELLNFWRRRGEDGEVVHDFTDPEWDTRFLGDLYQKLSEHARKTYALLQTPEFVEDFILDLTLEPAVDEFGLTPEPPNGRPDLPKGLRVIDPTCGSGHFLLGAFHRLLAKWRENEPTADSWDLINRVLYSVHGVDKNPFAVSIARFRLLIAAMKEGGVKRLADAPEFVINVAVGDSLLHGRGASGKQGILTDDEARTHTYATEDIEYYIKSVDILGIHSYHVAVGNPPYITAKDKQEKENYRRAYHKVCSGKYALTAPFAYRFFLLAKPANNNRHNAGYVGQITANSFMTREFGKKLIQDFFRLEVELTHIIDTSGAYIPGHGTPTVILIGRNMFPTTRPVRTALSIQGEPQRPTDPAQGLVWRSIVTHINSPGSKNEWITVADLERERFSRHPWNLSGVEASEIMQRLESMPSRLGSRLDQPIGFASFPGQDEAFFVGSSWLNRHNITWPMRRPLVIGEVVRDWGLHCAEDALVPYDDQHQPLAYDISSAWGKHLWTLRRTLGSTTSFEGVTRADSDEQWWTWYRWIPARYASPLSITFAFVATHNHFVLDRGGKVFNRSAPVIKLPESASKDDHLALLGILNSSTACFWLKQVSYPKGGDPEAWSDRYEFTGTKLQEFPLPTSLPLEYGRKLDELAQQISPTEASAICNKEIPSRSRLDEAKNEYARIRGQMVALQEELDWESYHLYGLLSGDEIADLKASWEILPEVKPGERAFEIVLARKIASGQVDTQWFARHGSTPITEVPAHWPEEYRRVVEKRIEFIEKRKDIALLERPEHKRRWATEPWEKKEKAALREWLLDRCENPDLWLEPNDLGISQPRPMTVNRLADKLREDADFVSVARLYAGPDADLAEVIAEITQDEHVPYLAALRYKQSGLRKRAQWEETWELQREEDATGKRLDIPVPPKYTSADFLKPSYWRNRGKLDVPKERFISYPLASPDGDGSLLLGWAGWDHRQQAHALMTLIEERTTRDGWERERLIPLLAGLAEVMPWVKQWHNEIDPSYGTSPAEDYASYLEDQKIRHNLSDDDLQAWRPPATGRGRKSAAKKSE